jgi:hypothetical protein
VLLGFASHSILDVAPHYDPDSELGYVLDASSGCAALALIATYGAIRGTELHLAAFLGAIGGALPDIELLVKLFDRDFETENYIFPWHNGTLPHMQTHLPGSTASQLALVAVMLGLVALKARRRGLRRA